MGAGRIYFKAFPLLTIITSMIAFLICTVYILGMRHRDRQEYWDILKEISAQEIPDMMVMLKEEDLWQLLSENRQALLLDESPVTDKIDETEEGKNESNCNKRF